jgi:hypothetical protein
MYYSSLQHLSSLGIMLSSSLGFHSRCFSTASPATKLPIYLHLMSGLVRDMKFTEGPIPADAKPGGKLDKAVATGMNLSKPWLRTAGTAWQRGSALLQQSVSRAGDRCNVL